MSHYRPYPAYKDSGVEWLGMVPEHWRVSAVKWEFESRLGKMLQPKPNDPSDIEVPYHKAVSVQWEQIAFDAPETMWASVSDIETYQIREGDLLICEGGDVGRAAIFYGNDSDRLIIQNSLHRVRPRNGNLNKTLLRIMQVVRAVGWFNVLCSKATIVHFTGEKLGSLAFPVAPPEEQQVINTYINLETTRIDALVSKKTRFIELLREKRQALITHAVTKGLDPNVKMKDSGVEWLGEVPEHWKITYVKRVVRSITQGWSPECESRPAFNGEWAVLKVGCVNGGIFRPTENKALPMALQPRPELVLKAGDVLVSRANTRELVGSCAVIPQDFPFLMLCDKLYRLIVDSGEVTPVYLAALISVYGRREVEVEANGTSSSMVNIAQSVILNLVIALPPVDEQIRIIAVSEVDAARIDSLIAKTERSIELLKERRSALITAAVTGQIDLREAV